MQFWCINIAFSCLFVSGHCNPIPSTFLSLSLSVPWHFDGLWLVCPWPSLFALLTRRTTISGPLLVEAYWWVSVTLRRVIACVLIMHPSPPKMYEILTKLTLNFELWIEIFCVPTCFHLRIPKSCLSVCPYPKKRNHPSFVNISPTLVNDTTMERSARAIQHGNKKIDFI